MKGGGAERSCAMLGVVEADHLRVSHRADTDEVCPLVAKVIAQKNISVVRDMINDGPKYRRIVKRFLASNKCSFFAYRLGQRRRCL